jgi:hypothetical protein
MLCMKHDECYGVVENDIVNCKGIINEYIAPYRWNFTDKEEVILPSIQAVRGLTEFTFLQIVCSEDQSGARFTNLFLTGQVNQSEIVFTNRIKYGWHLT